MTVEDRLHETAKLISALREIVGEDWELVNASMSDDEQEGFNVQLTLRWVPPSVVGGIL